MWFPCGFSDRFALRIASRSETHVELAGAAKIEAKVPLSYWLLFFPAAAAGSRLGMIHVVDFFQVEVGPRGVGDVALGGKRLDSCSRLVRI